MLNPRVVQFRTLDFLDIVKAMEEMGSEVVGRPAKIVGPLQLTCKGSGNRLVFEDGVVLKKARFDFLGDGGEISIGQKTIHFGALIVGEKCKIEIGKRVRMNAATRIHAVEETSIRIGHRCLLSDVRIRTSDMHSIMDIGSGARINPAADVIIEDSVWIAEDVRIYKGVRIGRGSVVGARSTVTRNLPRRCLCVGSPAKAVKKEISWDVRRL
ncbi:acyltransferase [Brevundimonas olei]|uniref:acyltransferase n=1 Tax=Brevundimonas olei TaxID=657642 RepID=UPI0031D17854